MPIFEYWNGIQAVCDTQTVLAQQNAIIQFQSYCNPQMGGTFTAVNTASTTWINYTGVSGGTGNTVASCYANQMFNSNFFEIDEEDYVNHAEYYELARQRGVQFRIRTAEETRLRAEATERLRVEQERLGRERQVIRERARELLVSHLTTEQRATFEKNKWFVVVGGKSKTEYRIRTDYGIAGNIDVMAKGRRVATLCCHCRSDIPSEDQFLAQKIALQWDEDNFLKTANRRAA